MEEIYNRTVGRGKMQVLRYKEDIQETQKLHTKAEKLLAELKEAVQGGGDASKLMEDYNVFLQDTAGYANYLSDEVRRLSPQEYPFDPLKVLKEFSHELEAMYDHTILPGEMQILHEIQSAEELLARVQKKRTELDGAAFKAYPNLSSVVTKYDKIITEIKGYINSLDPELPALNRLKTAVRDFEEKKNALAIEFDNILDRTVVFDFDAKRQSDLEKLYSRVEELRTAMLETAQNPGNSKKYADQVKHLCEVMFTWANELQQLGNAIQEELCGDSLLIHFASGTYHRLKAGTSLAGREAGCRVVLPFPTISRKQMKLVVSGSSVQVDNVSNRGTVVNGEFISDPVTVSSTAVLGLGDELFILAVGNSAKDLLKKKKLTALTALANGETHLLDKEPVNLDRDHSETGHHPEWKQPVMYKNQYIHRKAHSRIFRKANGCWYAAHVNQLPNGQRDNPTFVNDTEIWPYGEENAVLLHSGDVVRVWSEEFRFTEVELKETGK